ncbi:hypothetical protein [Streptomyces sp. R44]|uniref:Uncharacterized protein n=1 Tax=Streptomyces sp. R44 TaxID=3238633 RepID=A0AB39ST38_9ACTN
MTLVPEARAGASDAALPAAPVPATAEQAPAVAPVPSPAEPADTAVPEREPVTEPVPVPERTTESVPEPRTTESVPEPQATAPVPEQATAPVPEQATVPVPEQAAESVPESRAETVREADAALLPEQDVAPGAVQGAPADLPPQRAVPVEPPTGARAGDESLPRPEGDAPTAGRPRFGTVSVPEPVRTPPARRRDLPAVRAVRLTDEPPTPVARPGTAGSAAVTPVPLPLPRAVPTESRTEEPQP